MNGYSEKRIRGNLPHSFQEHMYRVFYNLILFRGDEAVSNIHLWWAVGIHIWKGAKYTECVRVVINFWFFVTEWILHNDHTVCYIQICPQAEPNCKGMQPNDQMRFFDFENIRVQCLSITNDRQRFSNYTIPNGRTDSKMTMNTLECSILSPFAQCDWNIDA